MVVPTASAIRGLSMSGKSPSSSRKSPAWPTPTSVPAVSKKSTKKNVKTMSAKENASTWPKPARNAPASGVMSYCALASCEASNPPFWTAAVARTPGCARPTNVATAPRIVVRRIPAMMDPRIPAA
jgi:hypothetical protein